MRLLDTVLLLCTVLVPSKCSTVLNFTSVQVWLYAENIVRVTHEPVVPLWTPTWNSSLVVDYIPSTNIPHNVSQPFPSNPNIYLISLSTLSILVNNDTKLVTFVNNPDNATVLAESNFSFILGTDPNTNTPIYHAKLEWSLATSDSSESSASDAVTEALYGFGEYQNGYLNYRDMTVRCVQYNSEACVPFFVSNKNYGILWDNYGVNVWNSQRSTEIDLIQHSTKYNLTSNKCYNFTALHTIQSTRLPNDKSAAPTSFGFFLSLADAYSWTASDSNGSTTPLVVLSVSYRDGSNNSSWLHTNVIEWFQWTSMPSSLTGKLAINDTANVLDQQLYLNLTMCNEKSPNLNTLTQKPKLYVREPSVYTDIECLECRYIDYYFIRSNATSASNTSNSSKTSKVSKKSNKRVSTEKNGIDAVISSMRMLTGGVSMYSLWMLGFWQSRMAYVNQSQLLYYASEFRNRGLPLDSIVQDWHYWGDLGWSPQFDPSLYPNPALMVSTLHGMNLHFMISTWGRFGVNTTYYQILKQKQWLLNNNNTDAQGWYNAYIPDANELFYTWINQTMGSIGADAFWLDGTEPTQAYQRNVSFAFGNNQTSAHVSGKYLYNTYSLYITGGVHDGWMNDIVSKSNRNLFILTRSAFLGQSKHGATLWSGDIKADWNVLYRQVIASLNYQLSGMPYWTHDVGAFFRVTDPTNNIEYRRMLIRWFQFGAFNPIFRTHGSGVTEYFEYGPVCEQFIHKIVNLRYRLLPYIYSMAYRVTSQGYTMQRALVFDFAEDENIYATKGMERGMTPMVENVFDESGFSTASVSALFAHVFMFGDSLLVAPVYNDDNQTDVYLSYLVPMWYNFWNGSCIKTGGSEGDEGEGVFLIGYGVDLDVVPIFVKSGSILFLGDIVQYSTQYQWWENEVRIYAGMDGKFTLYEDDSVSAKNIETGKYTLIEFEWIDSNQTLIIGDRQGSFDGMIVESRIFNFVIVSENHGVGVNVTVPSEIDKVVMYQGYKQVVQF